MRDSGVEAKAELLRKLHHGETVLVLPNAWDGMSAGVFEDCGFPAVATTSTIGDLVREITGPLNVLAGSGVPPLAELARLGVRRVSVGSGPARAIMGLVRSLGQELLESGTYSSMIERAIPYPDANALFARPAELR